LGKNKMEKKKVRYTVFGNRGSNYRGSVTQNYSTRTEAEKAVERVKGCVGNPRVKKIKVSKWMK